MPTTHRRGPEAPALRALCDELVARARFADDVLAEYAKRNHTTIGAISPVVAEAVRKACMSGLADEPLIE